MTYMLREHLLLEKKRQKNLSHLSRIRWCDKNIRSFDKIWMLVAVNVETWCKVAIQPKLQPLPAAAGCVHIVIWHNSRTLSYLTTSHSGTLFYIGRHSWTVYKVLLILGLLHSKSKTSWSRSWSVDPSKLQNTGIHKTFRHCRMASHPTVWFGLEWLGVACFGILCKILAGQYHKVR